MTYYIPDINAAAGYITKEVAPDGTIDYFGIQLDKAGIVEKYGAVLDFLPKRPTGFYGGMVDVIRKVFSIQEKTSYIEKIWRECDQVLLSFTSLLFPPLSSLLSFPPHDPIPLFSPYLFHYSSPLS